VAFARVAGNTGANTPGVDGLTTADVELTIGVPGFLDSAGASKIDPEGAWFGVLAAAEHGHHRPPPAVRVLVLQG
jgi:hypothetical protein